jgi:hypothetical protein
VTVDARRADRLTDEDIATENERTLAWLAAKTRKLSQAARKLRRRREAHVVVTVNQRGLISVSFRPEERPDTELDAEDGGEVSLLQG